MRDRSGCEADLDASQIWMRVRSGCESDLDASQIWMRVRSGCESDLDASQIWMRVRSGCESDLDASLIWSHDVHAMVTVGPVLIIMMWLVIVAVDGVVFASKCKSGSGCESGPGS